MPRKPISVPRYLAPLAGRIRNVELAIQKGLVVDHPSVRPERLKNGRVQLHARKL